MLYKKILTTFKHFQITNIDSLIFFFKNILYYINYILLENNHIILRRIWD